MLLHFCFHISLVVKKQKALISVITNITFISSGFKICISKTVCDDMVYCYCCFLVILLDLFIIGIILFWYNKFRKFCIFLQL